MKIYSDKHRLAVALALTGLQLPKHNRVKLMKPTNLYKLLKSYGWRWNGREWVAIEVQAENGERQQLDRLPLPQEVAPVNAADVFMIRIMAHKSRMPKITAEIGEFGEVFDWQVLSISEPHDNHGDGEFCRVYIRFRIRS